MGYKDIYDTYQEKYEKTNRLKFREFLEAFKRETGVDISTLARAYDIDTQDAAKEFCFLKWCLFNYNHKPLSYFYELLEDFGYDMFSEIIDTMSLIGKDTKVMIDPDVVNYAKISPYINRITVDNRKNGLVTIHSDELGDYSFYPSRVYLSNNTGALKLVNEYETAQFCHQMSWEMMNHFDKCELVTSLLPSYFEGTHYHTVLKNSEGLVVDAALEAVYTEETRDILFKAEDICLTPKEDLNAKLKLAIEAEDEESKKIDFPNAMLLTLHEQSKVLR
ncbi:MAG: hypothetical protein OSJ70_03825 [Bacilli bacterium]|nr:hypothetical protein [Bacilli bacterium]